MRAEESLRRGGPKMMTGAQFINVDGIRTRYFEKGSGETLVFFHGSHFGTTDACDSAIDWELNFNRLARCLRVMGVDKGGQGHTENPKSKADSTNPQGQT